MKEQGVRSKRIPYKYFIDKSESRSDNSKINIQKSTFKKSRSELTPY